MDVISSLWTDDENKLKSVYHCPKCGRALRLYRPMPVDGEFTAETVSEEIAE